MLENGRSKVTKFGKVPKSDRRAPSGQNEQHHSHLNMIIIIFGKLNRVKEREEKKKKTNLKGGGGVAGEKGSELKQGLVEVKHYEPEYPLYIFLSHSNPFMHLLLLLHYSPAPIHIYIFSLRLLRVSKPNMQSIYVSFTCASESGIRTWRRDRWVPYTLPLIWSCIYHLFTLFFLLLNGHFLYFPQSNEEERTWSWGH